MVEILHCSFCGKSQNEVTKLFVGPRVFRNLDEQIEMFRRLPDLEAQIAAAEKMQEEDQKSGRLPAIICIECIRDTIRHYRDEIGL